MDAKKSATVYLIYSIAETILCSETHILICFISYGIAKIEYVERKLFNDPLGEFNYKAHSYTKNLEYHYLNFCTINLFFYLFLAMPFLLITLQPSGKLGR